MLNLRQQHNFSTVVSCKSVASGAKQGDGACILLLAPSLSVHGWQMDAGIGMNPKP